MMHNQAEALLCSDGDLERSKKCNTTHYLADENILDGMTKLPVTQFMTQHCKDLWVVASLFLVLLKYL